jgi:hypothetical protein
MGTRHPVRHEPELSVTAFFEALAMAVVALAGQFCDRPFPHLTPRRRRRAGPSERLPRLDRPASTSEPAA